MSRDDYETLYRKAINGDPLAMYDLGREYPLGYDWNAEDEDIYWITKAYIHRNDVSKEVADSEEYKDKMFDASITVGFWHRIGGDCDDHKFALEAFQVAYGLATELGCDDCVIYNGLTFKELIDEEMQTIKNYEMDEQEQERLTHKNSIFKFISKYFGRR